MKVILDFNFSNTRTEILADLHKYICMIALERKEDNDKRKQQDKH